MKNKLLAMALAAVIQVAVLSGNASASAVATPDFPDWNSTGLSVVFVTDPEGDTLHDGGTATDIVKAWHATDREFHYFRMDLAQAPGTLNYAGIYGIYIDAFNGGSPETFSYLPKQEGIDYALDSHYNPQMVEGQGFLQHDFHVWEGGELNYYNLSDNRQTGNTLEWKISVSAINEGKGFSWFAATHDYAGPSRQFTYDRTEAEIYAPVPVPSAGLLFASALLGLSLVRRKS